MVELNLFEFKSVGIPDDLNVKDFEDFLNETWQKYREEKPLYWRENLYGAESDDERKKKQPFLLFEEGKLKSKNYIGYIKYKDFEFNLYPKICPPVYDKNKNLLNKKQINDMLLLWLQYSDSVILPKMEVPMDNIENCDFMEILIYLYAKYTADLLSVSVYQHYEEISEETRFLRGKLNFPEYIKNCAQGKAHKFHCTYDLFEINNKFNQIIKYVSKCLYEITKNNDNKNYLSEIIFALDEVDDVVCDYNDCESVYINRFLGEFNIVLDYCRLFLQNSVSFNESGDFDNFAFLLKTELLFEDFISNLGAEIIKEGIKIIPQSVSNLDRKGHFYIKPDLKIKRKDETIKIIDIKYKDINCPQKTSYNDISQADIYQCVTYALKHNCNDVSLLYPTFGKEKILEDINIEGINLSFKFIDCCPEENPEITKNKIKEKLSDVLFPVLN